MKDCYSIEIHRRVYDDDNGHYLTVRPSYDFPGNVLLITDDSEKDYFGEVRLDLPAPLMRKLAMALIAAADEVAE